MLGGSPQPRRALHAAHLQVLDAAPAVPHRTSVVMSHCSMLAGLRGEAEREAIAPGSNTHPAAISGHAGPSAHPHCPDGGLEDRCCLAWPERQKGATLRAERSQNPGTCSWNACEGAPTAAASSRTENSVILAWLCRAASLEGTACLELGIAEVHAVPPCCPAVGAQGSSITSLSAACAVQAWDSTGATTPLVCNPIAVSLPWC
mmetsp:Transcript_68735/g.177032  ORF Transcript_68735/g.177032 Transcript_68735/m.177032 type:complete len:204 (-) Transcript_68735:2407-3018(-)